MLDQTVKGKPIAFEREKELSTEIRYMPKGYISLAAINIFENRVYTFLWREKPFVFAIKNSRIAEFFKQYHKFLWKMGRK